MTKIQLFPDRFLGKNIHRKTGSDMAQSNILANIAAANVYAEADFFNQGKVSRAQFREADFHAANNRWKKTKVTGYIRIKKQFRATEGTLAYLNGTLDSQRDVALLPGKILATLADPQTSVRDRIAAVLFAETASFNRSQKPEMVFRLLEFATQSRFSNSDEVITAVGSAIRKLAMNMPESSFDGYSNLLVPTETDTLSCEIELEIAKGVSWRLMKCNIGTPGQYPNLEARLSDLASDYLTTRLILQKNYASIVIHAVIAVALLNGARQFELVDRIARLNMDWFSDLFARRLMDANRKRESATGNASHLSQLYGMLFQVPS